MTSKSSIKKALLFLLPTLGVYISMLLFSIPQVMRYSNGMKILDLMPMGYDTEYVSELFENLGVVGREVYLVPQLLLDMIYPALFAITYSLILTFVFERAFFSKSRIQKWSILPFFVGACDYLENIGIIVMLNIYPKTNVLIVNITSIFSILKSFLTIIVFAFIVGGVGYLMVKKVNTKI